MSSRWLYLPIDVKVREFDSKAYLAGVAAQKGWKVVLGRKNEVNSAMKRLPPGFFVGLGCMENFARQYETVVRNGSRVAILDEEGLVTWDPETYAKFRLNTQAAQPVDIYAAWGDVHADMVTTQQPLLHDKVHITGNPRFDVLHPCFMDKIAAEADALRAKYGDFILINSNFGSCNHFKGVDWYFASLKEKKLITDSRSEAHYRGYLDYRTKILHAFWQMLPELAATFPDRQIILRPHPSESHQGWLDAAQGLPNVHVVHEGSVIPWLQAAAVLIHNFCTTAVEAFVMQRRVIAFRPFIDEQLETPLPSLVSEQVFDVPQLLQKTQDILSGNPDNMRADKEKIAASYVSNIAAPDASEKLLAAMSSFAFKPAGRRRHPVIAPLLMRLQHLQQKLLRKQETENDYLAHKFAGMSADEVQATLQQFGLQNLRVREIRESCFLISK